MAIGGEVGAPPAGGRVEEARALRALVRTIAVARVDAGGLFSYVNDRWCDLYGRSAEDLLGQQWTTVVHPDDRQAVRAACRASLDQDEPAYLEYRIWDPAREHATRTWVAGTTIALSDDDDAGWLSTASDVTDRREAQETAVRTRRRLDKIVNSSQDVVVIIPAEGGDIWVSDAGPDIFGYDREAVVKQDPFAFVHPEDRDEAIQSVQTRVDGPLGLQGEVHTYRIATGNGGWRWLEAVGVNLCDDPDVQGLVLHCRDVTERVEATRALRSEHRRLTYLVDNVPFGVLLVDADRRVVATNRAFMELCRFPDSPESIIGQEEDVIGQRIRGRMADPDAYLAEMGTLREERRPDVNGDIVDVDDRVLERTFVPIDDNGENQGHLWLFRDITDERRVALERERVLRQEQQQNERLRELDALKSDFAAAISHELRTPLTSIVSFTELLRDGLSRDPEEEQREFLDIVIRNTHRLLRLVDDLLLLDRLEDGTLPLVPTELDVSAMVTMAVSSIRPAAAEAGIELESTVKSGPILVGDGDRLGQLVDILLNNALKFTGRGGRVRLDAHVDAGAWVLEVADSGIGIPERDLPNLFTRFFRASNARQRAITGSGLGLAIARGIAELHGGTIEASSAEGVGTTFVVTLRGAARVPLAPRANEGDDRTSP